MQQQVSFSPYIERYLFYFTVLITLAFLFYPPYLPMVDLPQHAAQVVTLDDLLKHQSPWEYLVTLNWDTPYLAGYGLWLLLYQFMSITFSAKILVSIIFLFYTYSIHLLRKSFHAEPILEWAAMTAFFGFAFQWGFITFLLAAPVGILFFLSCKQWLEKKQRKDFIIFSLLGITTYFCHALIFAFFCLLSYSYFLFIHCKQQSWKQRLIFTAPYLFYAAILGRYIFKPSLWMFRYYDKDYVFVSVWQKSIDLLYMPWNMIPMDYYGSACVVLLIAPFICGLQLSRNLKYYIPFIIFLIVYYAMPHIGFQTGYLYQRFVLFFIPFYYLMWEKRIHSNLVITNIAQIAYIFVVFAIGALLWKIYNNQILFSQEPSLQAFREIKQQIKPKKRILGLHSMYSSDSKTGMTSMMEFLYFANWYQAEYHGWADFNFASFHPQIVRFRPEYLKKLPSRDASQNGIRELSNCADYDYLLMKISSVSKIDAQTIQTWLQSNPNCQSFKLISQKYDWLLFGK